MVDSILTSSIISPSSLEINQDVALECILCFGKDDPWIVNKLMFGHISKIHLNYNPFKYINIYIYTKFLYL